MRRDSRHFKMRRHNLFEKWPRLVIVTEIRLTALLVCLNARRLAAAVIQFVLKSFSERKWVDSGAVSPIRYFIDFNSFQSSVNV